MVVKMMKWPPWPPSSSKKFEVSLGVKSIEGLGSAESRDLDKRVFFVQVLWKGQVRKASALGSLRRSTKKNLTKDCLLRDNGVVGFDDDEGFRNVCGFSGPREGLLYPWEIAFTVFNGLNQGLKSKVTTVYGTVTLNLSEYVSVTEGKEFHLKLPLTVHACGSHSCPSLNISFSMLELNGAKDLSGMTVQGSRTPSPLSTPSSGTTSSPAKDEVSALKAGLRKVKTFTDYVSSRKPKNTLREDDGSDCRSSVISDDAPLSDPFETDSPDEDTAMAAGEVEEKEEDVVDDNLHPVSYESLVLANCANAHADGEDESLVYYSNRRRSDFGSSKSLYSSGVVSGESVQRSLKRGGLLSWKRRKLNFGKSQKDREEPLLKRHYGDDGGDDIDYDRRQLSSSEESSFLVRDGSLNSEFGDDNFAVGSWERKEITSRDGLMTLEAQVFFASIDQRSERAAGESACTALVAVVTDWLQSNGDEMPIKSEFDSLIRDGSTEWRNLCENKEYLERFPDRHFDLETILEAKIRPLSVASEKSFIGFFHPEEGELEFLHGSMSFDNIWDEISQSALDLPSSSTVYIVSWNDHFFVLKVEHDAYYIIDTLGERLFEGCKQAYVLKFDKDTTIRRLPKEEEAKKKDDSEGAVEDGNNSEESSTEEGNDEKEEDVVCRGKETCKEYIKGFLAAIPIRELQDDLKKGLTALTVVHHRLQIEFHFTEALQIKAEDSVEEVKIATEDSVEEAGGVGMAMPMDVDVDDDDNDNEKDGA